MISDLISYLLDSGFLNSTIWQQDILIIQTLGSFYRTLSFLDSNLKIDYKNNGN